MKKLDQVKLLISHYASTLPASLNELADEIIKVTSSISCVATSEVEQLYKDSANETRLSLVLEAEVDTFVGDLFTVYSKHYKVVKITSKIIALKSLECSNSEKDFCQGFSWEDWFSLIKQGHIKNTMEELEKLVETNEFGIKVCKIHKSKLCPKFCRGCTFCDPCQGCEYAESWNDQNLG